MRNSHGKSHWQHLRTILALFFAERRSALLIGSLLAATTIMAGVALLGVSGWFITATAIAGLSTVSALMFDVFSPAAAIRMLAIVRTAARYGERLTTHDATLRILAAMREKLFRGWSEPGAARALLARPASLLFRLTVDIDALDSLYLRILVPAGSALAAAIIAGLTLSLLIHPLLGTGLCTWLLIIGLGVPVIAARTARRTARKRAFSLEAVRARSIDLASGQTELAVAGRLDAQCELIMVADARLAEADDDFSKLETATTAIFSMTTTIVLVGTLIFSAALVEAGSITPPLAALAVLIAFASVEPFSGLRRGALELGRTLLAAQRIGPRLESLPPEASPDKPPALLALLLQKITAGYDPDHPVLSNLSLAVEAGERVALIGTSGAGKSTLLNVVSGELSVTSGQVLVAVHTLLPQRTELFRDSFRENLRLAAPDATDDDLWQALESAGLAADLRKLPDGLDTPLGEGGLGLSGGQGRRFALARLFLRNTSFWLLDEPTEGLDNKTAQDVLDRLSLLAMGRTILFATHVLREAAIADRLIVMEKGHIICDVRRGDSGYATTLATLRSG